MNRPATQADARRTAHSSQRRRGQHPAKEPAGKRRNGALDTIRGLAIVLMIVDHVAVLLFDIAIGPDNIRLLTRLALPLFAILLGYLLTNRIDRANRIDKGPGLDATRHAAKGWLRRLGQVALASVAANLLFVPEFGRVEVLVSLLACMVLVPLLRRYFFLLVAAIALFPVDPTLAVFDYALTLTASLVAIGWVLGVYGFPKALLASLAVALVGLTLVPLPPLYVLLFSMPAVCIVAVASVSPEWKVGWLAWLGRYPLTIYVGQYYVIFIIRWFLTRNAG